MDEQPVVDISDEKLMATLSYVGILVFVPLLMRKQNSFVYFHIKQGVVLLIGEVIVLIASQWIVLVGNLLFVVLIIASVVGLVQALQGRRFKLPVIGDLAEKFSV